MDKPITCRERAKWQSECAYWKAKYELEHKRRIQNMAEFKKPDRLIDAVIIMLLGIGVAVALYGIMVFAHWCQYGY
jgi:hypothetical protein